MGYTPVRSTQARAERLSYYGPGISLEEGPFVNVESNLSSEEPDVEVIERRREDMEMRPLAPTVVKGKDKDFTSILQQQQKLLQEVMQVQTKIDERLINLEDRFSTLEESLSTPTISNSDGKRKRAVTHSLSVSEHDFKILNKCIGIYSFRIRFTLFTKKWKTSSM